MVRPLKNLSQVAVIGGGLAGLSAARHARRLGRLVTLFEGSGLYGGQVATVGHVDGLASPSPASGQDLAIALLEDVRRMGVRVVEAGVARLETGARLELATDTGEVHHPEAVVVASGASLRRLGVEGEERLYGRGVSRCATCDGGFFRGEAVAVVGGGDAAFFEALTLAPLVGRLHMVCRSPVRAKREYVDRLSALQNVDFTWDSEVGEVLGEHGVSGVRLRHVKTGAERELACSGVFPFVGVEPRTAFMPPDLRAPSGHLRAGPDLATGDPRIFAAGAVRAGYGGEIVQAIAEGVGAAAAAVGALAH